MSPKSSLVSPKSSEEVSMEDTSEKTKVIESSSSYLGKRKTEEDCESSSEEDEVTDSEEESEPETEPLWGYDSFEDRNYYSYSEGELADAFSDPESVKPALDYRRQLYLTRGFEVDPKSVPKDMITGMFPINLNDTLFGWKSPDGTARGYMELMGLDVKMDHVVRAIARRTAGIKCYITFMARETPTGPLVEYQAKTEWKRRQVHTYPIFCRPSPPPANLKEQARRSTRVRPKSVR
ncbi:unnamed protein product [Arabis nemorensis]|uniref:Uncharacterized protein n=1 Tax=Arabis nemorensis TaxID=586526 RepID=A0A565CT98_9BRAS|nr:unnamed protein product [Arabis nemorensis]